MNSLQYAFGTFWNTTLSRFPATARYFEDNDISWATTGKLAKEVAANAISGFVNSAKKAGSQLAANAAVALDFARDVAVAVKGLPAQAAEVLEFDYSALLTGWSTLSGKATTLGSSAWSELKVKAPALGTALLKDMQNLLGDMQNLLGTAAESTLESIREFANAANAEAEIAPQSSDSKAGVDYATADPSVPEAYDVELAGLDPVVTTGI